jgi:hypothetical protein
MIYKKNALFGDHVCPAISVFMFMKYLVEISAFPISLHMNHL